MTQKAKTRILIVDDSTTVRNLLKMLLSEDSQFEIAGIVSDGTEAVDFVKREKPDVISMDIHMPGMNGFEATRQIMSAYPVPIVIVSSAYHPGETQLSFKALEAGALAILPRPSGPGHPDFLKNGKSYRSTLKSLSEVRVVRRNRGEVKSSATAHHQEATGQSSKDYNQQETGTDNMIAIGASAGGPSPILTILKMTPKDIPSPILIVQHIDKGFAEGFAQWLGQGSAIPVIIPKDGDRLVPGHAYLAAGDHHLGIKRKGVVEISNASPEDNLRPAVSFLFRTVGRSYGKNAVALILSGMGYDGAKELKTLKEMGAYTLVQDEESALVYGMPGEAIRLHAACRVLPPERMTQAIINHFNSLKKL
ncbi:MAG: chemotaxis-specific protein-glutamate methyltransferase CheB [Bacteroidia bacterium]|nr:chemotaxis-specific protein-glutamate methyltransferase CheB [Bacteroidia bacterium]